MSAAVDVEGVALRPAATGDLAELEALLADPNTGDWLLQEAPADYLRDAAGDPCPGLFVAHLGDRLIGGGRLERQGFSYFTGPTVRGRGLGTVIARGLMGHYRARCPQAPRLIIRRGNQASERVAEKLGFRFQGFQGGGHALLVYDLPQDVWERLRGAGARPPSGGYPVGQRGAMKGHS